VHEKLAAALLAVGGARDAVPRMTRWNLWLTKTTIVPQRALPEGFSIGRVPADQIDIVISTSSIPRQPSTYLLLPSVGVLNAEGILVAWGYIGIDGSFATLFVQPEYRGKGLAKTVAVELLARSEAGDFADIGFDGSSGWLHSDVYDGNEASEAVMKSIGGKIACESFYIWIDSDKF
jgi:GNAT superfamily N-acetyltransferase